MNDRDLHERASALFLELRDLPDEERERQLLETSAGNDRLRHEVLSLLEHDFADSNLQDESIQGSRHRGIKGSSDGGVESYSHPALSRSREAFSSIGPYRVIERIGRGGSGVVLLAQQHEPVQRRVAIKIVPHAAISPDSAARFEFERRALERTEHPNIARILDAGRTADGLPYLVMEYVDGQPITHYCRLHGVGLRERIALMLDVADAVQHAHQRGVIHRDLKPANIFVSDVSGRPTPRVLDFGIAKPIPEAFEGHAAPTSGMPLGTPAYMAPEQCGFAGSSGGGGVGGGESQPVDTRADVYALGGVLYELGCGQPPLDVKGDPLEVLRRIRNAVPPPMSRVRAQNAAMFGNDDIPRSLLIDLDCILARALEKEPSRRYPTVAALAEDLRRLLRREPIEARPPTLRYRAARFAQRNRALVASLAVVAVALILGIGGLTAGLIQAHRKSIEAANQVEAQRAINRFLTDDLLAASSPDDQGQNITALELLHRASRKVDQRFPDQPLIAAAIHHTLGNAFMELGAFDDADHHLQRAIALRRSAAGINAPDTVRSEIAAASLLGRRERLAEADAALVQVIQRARLILGPDDPALYAALNDLGVIRETEDKGKDAVALLDEALAGRVRLLGQRDPLVLVTTSNLSQAYDRVGQTERSLKLQIDALHLAETLEDPPHMTLLGLNNNIGATYQDLRRNQEAAPYLRRAADLAAQWLGPDNPATLSIQANLAGLESDLGDPQRGAKLYEDVIAARIRLLGPDAPDTLTARLGRCDSLRKGKLLDQAIEAYTALLADMERVLGPEHWLAVQTRTSLARALIDSGRLAEALPLAEQATAQFTALYGPDHARTRTAAGLVEEIKSRLPAAAPP